MSEFSFPEFLFPLSSLQWSSELLIFVTVVAIGLFLLGFLVAYLIRGIKISRFSSELDASKNQHTQLEQEHQNLQLDHQNLQAQQQQLQAQLQQSAIESQNQTAQIDDLKQQQHSQALRETELTQQLTHSQQNSQERQAYFDKTEQRQIDEIQALKSQLEQTRQQQHSAEKQLESSQSENRGLIEQAQTLREEIKVEKNRFDEQQKEHQTLIQAHAQLKTTQDERDASHKRELANFEQQKASLSEQFKVLSNEILEAKTKALQENSKLSLGSVINPFQQSIDSFKKEVQEIHHRETTQRGELRKELESLKELNQKITTEAHELSTALRGQKKLQGNWGELVLENVLDRSGLQLGKDYEREKSITTEEGRKRPDAVVYLPQNKHLIIDAKVSLNAYTRYVNAEDEVERQLQLNEHVKAMSARIKELADRDYDKLPGLNSPEVVFMFVPIESAFVEALKADETLFQSAIESSVLVATPTTLLTSLNIVRQLWRFEDQSKHTAELASKADGVFKKLNSFLGSFEQIKKHLEKASETYTKAENQLVSGRGNLVKQVGEFKNLAPSIKAELPEYFTEKADLELDYTVLDSDKDPMVNVVSVEQKDRTKSNQSQLLFSDNNNDIIDG